MLVPVDETDSRDAVLEVRAGAGGDEASLFAMDLLRMYERYAARQPGWRFEILRCVVWPRSSAVPWIDALFPLSRSASRLGRRARAPRRRARR